MTTAIEEACQNLLDQRASFLRAARRKVENEHTAEDIFGDMFLTVIRHPKVYPPVIFRSRVNDYFRKQKTRKRMFSIDPDVMGKAFISLTTQLPEYTLIKLEAAKNIRKKVQSLPPNLRYPVQGYFFDGLTIRQMVGTVGTSYKTIKMRLYRGRNRLKKMFAKEVLAEKNKQISGVFENYQ